MLIGELCQRSGLSKGTIRYYESLGLIYSTSRQAGSRQYRDFDEQTLQRLEIIRNGKKMGFKLREGKPIIDALMNEQKSTAERRDLLTRQLEKITHELEQLEAARSFILEKVRQLD